MKILRGVVVLVALVAASFFVFKRVSGKTAPPVLFAPVTRGDVALTVQATGVLQASRTVNVGTQVSGVVKKIYVDYNSIVRKGELIAEIDPALSEAALESAQAAVDRANIQLQSAKDTLAIDSENRDREQSLFDHDLATEQDRETADLQVQSDQAQVEQDQASIIVAQAGVDQAKVTLGYCTIRSPIDGVVVTRNADEGQTVASGFAVPSLFVIATDIENLQLSAQVDEADIGKLHPGQDVSFTVDAYPKSTFRGTMTQVRLSATSTNNVVTYQAIVAVKNPDLKLLPSMTAKLLIDVGRATNAVLVPNAALRFRPNRDTFDALGQPPVEIPSLLNAKLPPSTVAPLPLPARPAAAANSEAPGVIDAKYGATPHPRAAGDVWYLDQGRLRLVPVIVGITDGTWSELIRGAVKPGDELVTMVEVPQKPGQARSPFVPQRGGYPRFGRGR